MTICCASTIKKLVAGQLYFFVSNEETKFNVVADNIFDSANYSFQICGARVMGGKTKVLVQKDFVVIQLLPIVYCDILECESQIFVYENSPCIVRLYNDFLSVTYKDININKKLIKNKINLKKLNNSEINLNKNCQNNLNYSNLDNNYKINIFDKKIKNNLLLFIELKNNIKKYYIILNKNKILYNNYLKEININDNLIILDDNINCLGEKTVFEFDLESDCQKKYAVQYIGKTISTDLATKFLDATKVGNQKLVKECLALDIDIDTVQEFLGEYDDFLKIENCYILLHDFQITKAINLEIADNKICNIYE